MHNTASVVCISIHFDDDTSIYHDIRYIDTTQMCIDTVSLPMYHDMAIYRYIVASLIYTVNMYIWKAAINTSGVKCVYGNKRLNAEILCNTHLYRRGYSPPLLYYEFLVYGTIQL